MVVLMLSDEGFDKYNNVYNFKEVCRIVDEYGCLFNFYFYCNEFYFERMGLVGNYYYFYNNWFRWIMFRGCGFIKVGFEKISEFI